MAVLTRDRRHHRGRSRALAAAGVLALVALSLLAAGCSCSRSAGEGLEGIDWELQGSSASSVDFRVYRITARFDAGTLKGRSAVNSYSAKYVVGPGSSLEISGLTQTLMAGTPDAMSAEEIYATMLRAVRSWGLDNGQLELRDARGNPLLIYSKADRATAPPSAPGEQASTPAVEASAGPPSSGLSDTSVAYARSIGGTGHRGELLYVIVGSTYPSEAAASAALNQALPLFGDMQSYFIVQRSDNFAGLGTRQWVTIEAFRRHPDESSLQLAQRAFPEAVVKRVTVRTDDPIPVYEDLVGR